MAISKITQRKPFKKTRQNHEILKFLNGVLTDVCRGRRRTTTWKSTNKDIPHIFVIYDNDRVWIPLHLTYSYLSTHNFDHSLTYSKSGYAPSQDTEDDEVPSPEASTFSSSTDSLKATVNDEKVQEEHTHLKDVHEEYLDDKEKEKEHGPEQGNLHFLRPVWSRFSRIIELKRIITKLVS